MTRPSNTARGRFVTFEGGEGVGKSTQIAHLAKRLDACGRTYVVSREPGGSVFAERARALLLDPGAAPKSSLAQALLLNAARVDHLETLVRPALADGRWVLCDRFSDSTHAYQGAAGGVAAAVLGLLDGFVLGDTRPDLTILLDLDPKIGLARANQRRTSSTPGAFVAADTFESRHLEFHQRLRDGFLKIARAEPQRIIIVDAFENELTVADRIWRQIADRWPDACGSSAGAP